MLGGAPPRRYAPPRPMDREKAAAAAPPLHVASRTPVALQASGGRGRWGVSCGAGRRGGTAVAHTPCCHSRSASCCVQRRSARLHITPCPTHPDIPTSAPSAPTPADLSLYQYCSLSSSLACCSLMPAGVAPYFFSSHTRSVCGAIEEAEGRGDVWARQHSARLLGAAQCRLWALGSSVSSGNSSRAAAASAAASAAAVAVATAEGGQRPAAAVTGQSPGRTLKPGMPCCMRW